MSIARFIWDNQHGFLQGSCFTNVVVSFGEVTKIVDEVQAMDVVHIINIYKHL